MAKKIQHYAQKKPDEDMYWEDKASLDAFRKDATPGRWRADFVLERKPKSQSQLGYMFGCIVTKIKQEANENRQEGVDSLLKFLIDPDIPKGQAVTDDFIKALCYMIAPTFDDKGRKKTLSSMNTLEAKDFMDRVRNILANYVDIDDPDKEWKDGLADVAKESVKK
ncbi:hypothetical protein KAR91_57245 [Candidatus Pacearchaeota archaeon]|nr:hypothetical protein [Candidatus Pacearchaeota archaeon]